MKTFLKTGVYIYIYIYLFFFTTKAKDPPRLSFQVLALFGMTSRTLDRPITCCAINPEIRVANSQLDYRILL